MKHFYHGTSFDFDAFDDSKVVTSGPNGACENGRGTYLTGSLDFAQGWEHRNNGKSPHTVRIDVTEAAWDQNFIHHEKTFNQKEAASLAITAANRGYHKAAGDIAHMIRRHREKDGDSSFTTALTGKDLADLSRYNVEVVHLLDDLGYRGFKYGEDRLNGKIENIVFFNAADIPSMTPMDVTKTSFDDALAQGAAAPATDKLSAPLEKLFDKIDASFAAAGLDTEKADAAKADIQKLVQLAATKESYDPLTETHPLKLAEVVILVHSSKEIRQGLQSAAGEFIETSMTALGHSARHATLDARPAQIPEISADQGFQPDGSIVAFRKHLLDNKYIASEELERARRDIARQHPTLLKSFDRIVDQLHEPGVDFSMRNAFGLAITRAYSGQFAPTMGETTLDNMKETLAYNASTCHADMRTTLTEIERFGVTFKYVLTKPAEEQPATPAAKQPQRPQVT